ncbi:MAG: hypothetical protein IKU43_04565 [Clostridia bacterium]|nr:hypothetical protein [Clostridia bacterium]
MNIKKILVSLFAGLVGASVLGISAMAENIEIGTADDLKAYAEAVNGGADTSDDVVKLTANIDLGNAEWTPIGKVVRSGSGYKSGSTPFEGKFDGGDYTISNLYISVGAENDGIGLFGGIADGAEIKNVRLEEVDINTPACRTTGGLVGIMAGGTVENCVVYGDVTAKCAGGIVGRMLADGTVKKCINFATVTATGSGDTGGGIVGKAYYTKAGKEMNIIECTNNGNIIGDGAYGVGGIAGFLTGNATGCKNNGDVVSDSGESAGGIISEHGMYGEVSNNTNNGDVIIESGAAAVGGIIGWLRYTGNSTDYERSEKVAVINNVNNGNISSITTATTAQGVGGIVGTVYGMATISGNQNRAESIIGNTHAAGVVGYAINAGETTPADIQINENTSSTAIENISAENTALFTFTTHAGVTAENNSVSFVAEVDGEKYTALSLAVEDASDKAVITILDDVILTETVTIPEGKTLTIDLAGNSISMAEDIKTTTYAIANLGTLTLKDSEGEGSVSSRGIYNGYDNGTIYPNAVLTVESGTYNALGTNGGAAVFNYGTAYINGGDFTSIGGYSLNNQSGASMTVEDGITANNGIYNNGAKLTVNGGEITGNRSGCHVIYAWNANVTINGGEFFNYNSGNATVMVAGSSKAEINGGTFGIKDGRVPGNGNTWTSCLLDTVNTATMVINDGEFNGGFRVQAGTKATINGGSFNDIYGSKYNIYGTVEVKGGIFEDAAARTFAGKYLADGYKTTTYSDGTFTVIESKIDGNTTIKVEFVKADKDDEGKDTDRNADLYNINLVADADKVINRLNSADLTFALTQVSDNNEFEIIASNKYIVINPVNNSKTRYEFHFDGKDNVEDTARIITIGQVKITGYGKYSFGVATADTNAVHATEALDNIVDTYTPDGDITAGEGYLNIGTGTGTVEIFAPTQKLTINVSFPNSVENNAVGYQDMTVVVTGEDIEDITIELGKDNAGEALDLDNKNEAAYTLAFADNTYTIEIVNALTANTAYNVTVSGAGYRTARYTVNTQETDKTLNFWNNVKDNDTLVEEKKDSSAKKVTFLAGDIVKDSLINIYDLSAVVSYFGEIDLNKSGDAHDYAKYDLNRDGKIDSKDVAYVLVSWGK